MSDKKNINENQDTMKFKVPARSAVSADQTRVYRKEDLEEAKKRAALSEANRKAVQQKNSSGTSDKSAQNQNRTYKTSSSASEPKRQQQRRAVPANETGSSRNVHPNARPAKKKKGTFGRFVRFLIGIFIALFLVYSAAALYYITKITPIENSGSYINDPDTMLYSSEVKNILVIGEDTRDNSVRGLSDSMILLSVNKKNHKLQMTSFMRDIYTEIDGYGSEKLNAAYSYGGAELLKDTIEDNFKIRIDGCMTVNFTAVAHIVDAVGGVQITVSASEANAINEILYSEVNEIMGDSPDADFLPVSDGTFMLNGKQALSYSRIRYVGDADFERTQRQRTVITQIMSRMKKINPVTFNAGITKALQYIGSDMSVTDMYILSLRLPSLLASYEPEQLRVPADGTWSYGETWDGMSIINVDFYANTEYLKNNIYLPDTQSESPEEETE